VLSHQKYVTDPGRVRERLVQLMAQDRHYPFHEFIAKCVYKLEQADFMEDYKSKLDFFRRRLSFDEAEIHLPRRMATVSHSFSFRFLHADCASQLLYTVEGVDVDKKMEKYNYDEISRDLIAAYTAGKTKRIAFCPQFRGCPRRIEKWYPRWGPEAFKYSSCIPVIDCKDLECKADCNVDLHDYYSFDLIMDNNKFFSSGKQVVFGSRTYNSRYILVSPVNSTQQLKPSSLFYVTTDMCLSSYYTLDPYASPILTPDRTHLMHRIVKYLTNCKPAVVDFSSLIYMFSGLQSMDVQSAPCVPKGETYLPITERRALKLDGCDYDIEDRHTVMTEVIGPRIVPVPETAWDTFPLSWIKKVFTAIASALTWWLSTLWSFYWSLLRTWWYDLEHIVESLFEGLCFVLYEVGLILLKILSKLNDRLPILRFSILYVVFFYFTSNSHFLASIITLVSFFVNLLLEGNL
jgi:hypothetical protein